MAFSPQEHYTDRATAKGGKVRDDFLRLEVVAWSMQRFPTAVDLGFLRPHPYFFPFKLLLRYPHENELTPFKPTTAQKF
jgi:hypothetical protein